MSVNLNINENKNEVIDISPCPINELPKDVLLELFKNLSLQTLATCSQVCKKWRTTLGTYGDKLFLKFFKGGTVKEKLRYQVITEKSVVEANEKTQLLGDQNKSANRKKLFLKIAIIVGFFLFCTALAAVTVLTWGATAGAAVYAGGLVGTIALSIVFGTKC